LELRQCLQLASVTVRHAFDREFEFHEGWRFVTDESYGSAFFSRVRIHGNVDYARSDGMGSQARMA
jgi:hypothetical protein